MEHIIIWGKSLVELALKIKSNNKLGFYPSGDFIVRPENNLKRYGQRMKRRLSRKVLV